MRNTSNAFTVKSRSALSETCIKLACIDLLDWCLFSHINTWQNSLSWLFGFFFPLSSNEYKCFYLEHGVTLKQLHVCDCNC